MLGERGRKASAVEGKSPVTENIYSQGLYRSSAGHVKSGMKAGGPPPKAKYYWVTDSERVP